jgi:ribonuclease P protein component
MNKDVFAQAIKKGKKIRTRTITVIAGEGEKGKQSKVAIATKKKLGTAVARNRIRRRIKAAIFKISKQTAKEKAIVVFPNITAKKEPFDCLCYDVKQAFNKAGLLK